MYVERTRPADCLRSAKVITVQDETCVGGDSVMRAGICSLGYSKKIVGNSRTCKFLCKMHHGTQDVL